MVSPTHFEEPPKDNFRHQPDGVPTTGLFTLGMKLLEDCPKNDCIIYRNIFKTCLELDEQIDRVTGRAREVLNSELRREVYELWEMLSENYAVGEYRKERRRRKARRGRKGGEGMTGIEFLKAPDTTAGELADIISAPCPR